MIRTYEQSIEWLTTLHRFGIKLGLEQTQQLAELCSVAESELKFIHLAGTNGKGSTGAMLECALRSNGYTTGFYSSPHLISACERFRINGEPVCEEEFAAVAEQVRIQVDVMREKGLSPTYFEATTVMALIIFKNHGCDYVVWETGMGGRLDSSNIVTPVVSVITNIALDHEKYLGSTLEQIAFEKAGIIKRAIPVVAGVMPEAALKVIKDRAAELESPLRCIDEAEIISKAVSPGLQSFTFAGEAISVSLNGPMQQRNAAVAVSVLQELGVWNSTSSEALKHCRWPGRVELLNKGRFILDGGHNPDGLNALCETLKTLYPGKKYTWVFGAFADKDFGGGLQIIAPLAERLYAVGFAEESRLSASPEAVCEVAAASGIRNVYPVGSLRELLTELNKSQEMSDVPVIIAGSLYLAGEVLSLAEDKKNIMNLQLQNGTEISL